MTVLDRRKVLSIMGRLAALGAFPALAQQSHGMALGDGAPFDAETVIDRARARAAARYVAPPEISPEWRDLTYDVFRGIWFDSRNALFHGTDDAVEVGLFVAGLYSTNKIHIYEVQDGTARPVLFDLDAFTRIDWFPNLPPQGIGFVGLRLRAALWRDGRRAAEVWLNRWVRP